MDQQAASTPKSPMRWGTWTERSPVDQQAWTDRVRAVHERARAALLVHGAIESQLAAFEDDGVARTSVVAAFRAFFGTLTEEQKRRAAPLTASGTVDAWTSGDIFGATRVGNGLTAVGVGQAVVYDEVVALAEILWPATEEATA